MAANRTIIAPSGKDLMRKINAGELKMAPLEYVEEIKDKISENCEELIEVGARIRPLMVDNKRVGWVRGVHAHERKMFKRWVKDPNDFIATILNIATTFSKPEIEALSSIELRSLAEVVKQMSDYDASLYPYLAAYVTTQSSENMWHSRGEGLSSYENRIVTLPDEKTITIVLPPDHARAWASLCHYRDDAKRRLDDNFNALFVVRPTAGKSADPVHNELMNVARQLETDSLEPWEKVVRIAPEVDVTDGWAHAGDSEADLLREMKGMLANDKHERLMAAWQKQMEAEADTQKKKLEAIHRERGGPGITQRMEILTDAEVKERQKAIKQGNQPKAKPQPTREEREVQPSILDRLKRYQ